MDPFQLLDPLDLCVYCAYQCLAYNTTELDPLFGSYVYYGPVAIVTALLQLQLCSFMCSVKNLSNG